MKNTYELTLNNPLTEEQWDMISDVDFDRTDRITFHTKHGKEVEFAKVIRCKDCSFSEMVAPDRCYCEGFLKAWVEEDDFCAWAYPKVKK